MTRNISEYQPAWHAWWFAMQPDWRQKASKTSWPLSRALSPDDRHDWNHLFRAGPNGLFLLMMSLAWWAESIAKSAVPQYHEFGIAVDDVLWVLSDIMLQLPTAQLLVKRSSPDTESDEPEAKPKAKRCVNRGEKGSYY